MPWDVFLWTTFGIIVSSSTALYILLLWATPSRKPAVANELYYHTCLNQVELLGSIQDSPTVAVSIVVPAYNESLRLAQMLGETIDYLTSEDYKTACRNLDEGSSSSQLKNAVESDSWEIIVVDDGSNDDTFQIALEHFRQRLEEGRISEAQARLCKVVALAHNRGKGGAVQHGIMHASGLEVLYADADGASQISDLIELRKCLARCRANAAFLGHGIAVGSRAHMVHSEVVVKRSFIRNALMHSFHLLLSILAISSIADTQCGFKLLARKTAQRIISSLHVQGWIFDVEIFLLAQRAGLQLGGQGQVREVYIHWCEKEGSKINLVWDSLRMLRDLIVIRLNYLLGRWTLATQAEIENDYRQFQDLKVEPDSSSR